MICPKCKKEIIKQGENYFINEFGILVSHNISCDNKYLRKWKQIRKQKNNIKKNMKS